MYVCNYEGYGPTEIIMFPPSTSTLKSKGYCLVVSSTWLVSCRTWTCHEITVVCPPGSCSCVCRQNSRGSRAWKLSLKTNSRFSLILNYVWNTMIPLVHPLSHFFICSWVTIIRDIANYISILVTTFLNKPKAYLNNFISKNIIFDDCWAMRRNYNLESYEWQNEWLHQNIFLTN